MGGARYKREKMEGKRTCEFCGAEMGAQAVVCPSCGKTTTAKDPTKKFCKHCGAPIDKDCVVCSKCGKQVEELHTQQPQVVINNTNSNVANANANVASGAMPKAKNKWVAFLLCFFLGFIGAHKFYEGKILLGIVYIFTGGIFGIGILVDLIRLLFKPNPYYV